MIKEVIDFVINEENNGVRLDKLIADELDDFSRTQVQGLITDKLVSVNDKPVKANYKAKLNDKITIMVPEVVEYEIEPINMNLNIVYEDSYVAVVSKPFGLVVHPSSTSKDPTLVHGLMYQIKDLSGINGVMRPGIVHRIDKDTSGLLMVAKNDLAHESLVNQLKDRTINRLYTALVYGNLEVDSGKIKAPIARDPHNRLKMGVVEGGKEAITNFRVIKRYKDFTLIECKLETGRTHQIRVHLSYIGHPLVGDPLYGPKKVIGNTGQFLHAGVIGFNHPKTNEYMEFKEELPDYFKEMLDSLE